MKKFFLTTFIALTFSTPARCEYRVYQYFVKSKLFQPQNNESYLVTSTLDPVSYISYHGGNSSLKVDMVRTWTCKGHTGNKQVCPAPFENNINQENL